MYSKRVCVEEKIRNKILTLMPHNKLKIGKIYTKRQILDCGLRYSNDYVNAELWNISNLCFILLKIDKDRYEVKDILHISTDKNDED